LDVRIERVSHPPAHCGREHAPGVARGIDERLATRPDEERGVRESRREDEFVLHGLLS
jgi:hypothetical protein